MNFSDQIKKALKNKNEKDQIDLNDVKLRLISLDIVEKMFEDYISGLEKVANETGLNEIQKQSLTIILKMLEKDIQKIPIINVSVDDKKLKGFKKRDE